MRANEFSLFSPVTCVETGEVLRPGIVLRVGGTRRAIVQFVRYLLNHILGL